MSDKNHTQHQINVCKMYMEKAILEDKATHLLVFALQNMQENECDVITAVREAWQELENW